MATFRYKALTAGGKFVSGSIDAASRSEVARRIEYLGLLPIEMHEGRDAGGSSISWTALTASRPKPASITVFSRDLALVLGAGVRLEDALELIASDASLGSLRSVVGSVRSAVLSGDTLATALARHPDLFPPIYVSLVRVGEASGTLNAVLQALADERTRSSELRRKLVQAISYPAFVLGAAVLVVVFFIGFVLPQFGSVLRDFGAKVDPIVSTLLDLSELLNANREGLSIAAAGVLAILWLTLRRKDVRAGLTRTILRLPVLRSFAASYQAALFCRTLGVLLSSGVGLATALRMLTDTMGAAGGSTALWSKMAERVRQGGRLADAVAETNVLPPVAARMLRLGEETGQLAPLALKTAELFEIKLERGLDRFVAVIGPAAILSISVIVGGLIVSIMTSLLSITQLVN